MFNQIKDILGKEEYVIITTNLLFNDIYIRGEDALCELSDFLDTDVMKASHHTLRNCQFCIRK